METLGHRFKHQSKGVPLFPRLTLEAVCRPLTSAFLSLLRSQVAAAEAQGEVGGGEAAEDGVQRRAAGQAEARVRREPLPDGEAPHRAGPRAGAQRGADQDLVPEQAGQDQEGLGRQEPAGAAAHGAGAVQPLDGARRRGGGGGPERPHPGRPAAAATAAAPGHVGEGGTLKEAKGKCYTSEKCNSSYYTFHELELIVRF